MTRTFWSTATLLSALLLSATINATARNLQPDDIYALRAVSSPAVSPDGQWVAYIVTLNDRTADERRFELRMIDSQGHEAITLAAPSASLRTPRFSPDGRYLAYIATPTGSHHSQIMLLDRRGGEPVALTHVSGDLGDYAWSPDGRQIVATLEADDALADETPARPKPIVIRDWHFKQDVQGYLATGHDRHLINIKVSDGSVTALTQDPAGQEDHPVWSPDGRWIAFTRTHQKGGDPDGSNDIAILPAAGGPVRVLTRAYVSNQQGLEFTPDSRLLSYRVGFEPRYYAYQQDQLAVIPVDGGASHAVTAGLDRAVMSAVLLEDSQSAVIAIEDDGSLYPARVNLSTGKTQRLVTGKRSMPQLARGGSLVVAVGSDDVTPSEVYVLEDNGPRRLTHETDAFMATISLGAVEDLVFKSRDGTEVHGLVTRPPDYTPGKRYPTVLWIHGGPNGQDEHSQDYEAYQFRRQFMAAAGYVVVGINYRGSSGRGFDYARAIYADWGHKEVEDLLAGMDAVVASGLADPERLMIGGWSYGGILTDYTIVSDHRFKAATSGAGSGNQFLMYGIDQYVMQYERELGMPWRDTATWMKVSYPFFHADRIHTPTLFMGGDRDFNVPVSGGEQMYQALRSLGVPTELVVYPDQFHDVTRPSFVKDRMERVQAWFEKFGHPRP
jgi:dipeptidyl aminopeptidase/acylaminoacyl peptidase